MSANVFEVSIETNLLEAFQYLGKRGIENASRRAVRKTLAPITLQLKRDTPVKSGALVKSFKTKVSGGSEVTGVIWTENKWISVPKESQKRVTKKGRVSLRKVSEKMVRKNPYLYARKVNETSRANRGFFDDSIKESYQKEFVPGIEKSMREEFVKQSNRPKKKITRS